MHNTFAERYLYLQKIQENPLSFNYGNVLQDMSKRQSFHENDMEKRRSYHDQYVVSGDNTVDENLNNNQFVKQQQRNNAQAASALVRNPVSIAASMEIVKEKNIVVSFNSLISLENFDIS